jgi:hypothetical protein
MKKSMRGGSCLEKAICRVPRELRKIIFIILFILLAAAIIIVVVVAVWMRIFNALNSEPFLLRSASWLWILASIAFVAMLPTVLALVLIFKELRSIRRTWEKSLAQKAQRSELQRQNNTVIKENFPKNSMNEQNLSQTNAANPKSSSENTFGHTAIGSVSPDIIEPPSGADGIDSPDSPDKLSSKGRDDAEAADEIKKVFSSIDMRLEMESWEKAFTNKGYTVTWMLRKSVGCMTSYSPVQQRAERGELAAVNKGAHTFVIPTCTIMNSDDILKKPLTEYIAIKEWYELELNPTLPLTLTVPAFAEKDSNTYQLVDQKKGKLSYR